MQYKTHNQKKINIGGTCLQGYIEASYERLVSLFGQPCNGDAYKIDAEWIVEFDDGTITTIYNWKNGKNYCGNEGENVENMTDWHIGGHNKDAVYSVMAILNGNPEEQDKKRLQAEIEALKQQKACIVAAINAERNRVILEMKSAIKIINEL